MKNKISLFTYIVIIIMIGVIIIIGYLYSVKKLDPQTYGPIGDSVSGLLTPFLTMITIIVIYESFRMDRKRHLQDEERVLTELLNTRIERVHKSIDSFSYTYTHYETIADALLNLEKGIEVGGNGIIGIEVYYKNFKNLHDMNRIILQPMDVELENIYKYCSKLLSDINDFNPINTAYKEDVVFNFKLLYSSKIQKIVTNFKSLNLEESKSRAFWGTKLSVASIEEIISDI